MREHLYHARRVDNNEWVEGCLLIDYITGQYFIHTKGNSVNESDKVNEEGCLKFFAFEVDPKTIGEFTGLTDKNNVKIFENNIVSMGKDEKEIQILGWCVVRYNSEQARYSLYTPGGTEVVGFNKNTMKNYYVVGVMEDI